MAAGRSCRRSKNCLSAKRGGISQSSSSAGTTVMARSRSSPDRAALSSNWTHFEATELRDKRTRRISLEAIPSSIRWAIESPDASSHASIQTRSPESYRASATCLATSLSAWAWLTKICRCLGTLVSVSLTRFAGCRLITLRRSGIPLRSLTYYDRVRDSRNKARYGAASTQGSREQPPTSATMAQSG